MSGSLQVVVSIMSLSFCFFLALFVGVKSLLIDQIPERITQTKPILLRPGKLLIDDFNLPVRAVRIHSAFNLCLLFVLPRDLRHVRVQRQRVLQLWNLLGDQHVHLPSFLFQLVPFPLQNLPRFLQRLRLAFHLRPVPLRVSLLLLHFPKPVRPRRRG